MESSNFFYSVSKHDLERFHSECLCWLFNNNSAITAEWIKEINKNYNKAPDPLKFPNHIDIVPESIKAYTEVEQLDIVLVYKIKSVDTYFGIIIENKVKANEHIISVKNNSTLPQFPNEIKHLSQTEYYFHRNIAIKKIIEQSDNKITKEISLRIFSETCDKKLKESKKLNKKNITYIDLVRDNCHYLFLVPNKIVDIKTGYDGLVGNNYKYNELNQWRDVLMQTENPWVTYTYVELASFLDNNKTLISPSVSNNSLYAKDYIEFLYKQFSKHVDLDDYKENKFGKLEYMKFLRQGIFNKLNKDCQQLNESGKVEASSSNSADPLFSFIINKEVDLGISEFKGMKFEVGIQVQGLSNKIYISAGENYNEINFKKNQAYNIVEYRKKAQSELNKIIHIDTGSFKFDYLPEIEKIKPNKNKHKTFYSYSFQFKTNSKSKDVSIENKIDYLSVLINKMFEIYNGDQDKFY